MASTLSSDLVSRLAGAPTTQIAQRLGVSPDQAKLAIGAALPLLLGALGRNASQPQGAQELFGALQEHQGQDLDNVLESALGGQAQGPQILGHVFGGRQPRAAQAVGQTTGLGQDKAHLLLRWLAPIAMAYLAKRMFDMRQPAQAQAGQDAGAGAAPSPQALSEVLQQEARQAEQQHGGLLGAVLDRDGDGDVDFADLLKAGQSVLGGGARPSQPL